MHSSNFPQIRLRRLRQNAAIRTLIQDTHLEVSKFILPIFIKANIDINVAIPSLPGHFQLSLNCLAQEVEQVFCLGINNIILFGVPKVKDALGSDSYFEKGIIQSAIRIIKNVAPQMLVFSDVCLCEYTTNGHCEIVNDRSYSNEIDIDNDKTLTLLMKQAVSHAQAGADVIAPSGCIDGMVQAIRKALDAAGFQF